MLAIIVGLVFFALGLWGMVTWWTDFVVIIKGAFPIMIATGGLLAVIAGLTSIKDLLDEKVNTSNKTEVK